MIRSRLSILLLLLVGCEPDLPTCVQLVDSGEFATRETSYIVRMVGTDKLVRAARHDGDYVTVEDDFCLKRDTYGDIVQ